MLGQFQPVGAGDRDIGVLQRLDDRIERVAAPPHQHQHVTVAQGAAIADTAGHGAAFDQPPDLGLNALCELNFRARLRQSVERRAPAFDVLLVVPLLQFPELDQARPGVGQCLVHWISIFRMDAAVDLFVAKHMIDRLQDRRP